MQDDLFTGTWIFTQEESQLSTPPPLRWIQRIDTSGGRIRVQEEITRSDGSTISINIDAAPDGEFHPASGSPIADAISYVIDGACISGVARRNGIDSMRERLLFSDSGKMTMIFSVLMNSKEVASGTACFTKVDLCNEAVRSE